LIVRRERVRPVGHDDHELAEAISFVSAFLKGICDDSVFQPQRIPAGIKVSSLATIFEMAVRNVVCCLSVDDR